MRAFEEGPAIDHYLLHSHRVPRHLGQTLAERLRQAETKVLEPEGGFYLFPDFSPLADVMRKRGLGTGTEMCERLLDETGVSILPRSDFGRPPEELTARLAYVDFDSAAALDASESVSPTRLDSWVSRQNQSLPSRPVSLRHALKVWLDFDLNPFTCAQRQLGHINPVWRRSTSNVGDGHRRPMLVLIHLMVYNEQYG